MFHHFGTVTNTHGDSLPGWQVECVQLSDGETIVPIFSDENSTPIETVSGIANRAITDAEGNVDFWVPNGTYSLRYYDNAGVFRRLQRGLSMYGASQFEGGEDLQEIAELAVTARNTPGLLSANGGESAVLAGENGGLFRKETGNAPYAFDDVNVLAVDGDTTSAYIRDFGVPFFNPGNDQFAGAGLAWGIVRKPSAADPIEILNNGTHVSLGYDSVLVSDGTDTAFNGSALVEGTVKVSSSVPAYTNGIHLVSMDETYAGQGVFAGIRGFADGPSIFFFRQLEFTVNMQSGGVSEHPYWDGEITAVRDTVAGTVTITHPAVNLSSAPCNLDPLDSPYEPQVIATTNTSITLVNKAPLGGIMRRIGGGAYTYDGSALTEPTATFDAATGELAIDLGQAVVNGFHHSYWVQCKSAGVYVDSYDMDTSGGGNRRIIRAILRNRSDDSLVTDDVGLEVTFGVPQFKVIQTLVSGVIRITRDYAQVNFERMASANGNAWVFSTMPYNKN